MNWKNKKSFHSFGKQGLFGCDYITNKLGQSCLTWPECPTLSLAFVNGWLSVCVRKNKNTQNRVWCLALFLCQNSHVNSERSRIYLSIWFKIWISSFTYMECHFLPWKIFPFISMLLQLGTLVTPGWHGSYIGKNSLLFLLSSLMS